MKVEREKFSDQLRKQNADLEQTHISMDSVLGRLKLDNSLHSGVVYVAPTNNCQLACVSSFNELIQRVAPLKGNEQTQTARDICTVIREITGRRILLVDIGITYFNTLREIPEFNRRIRSSMPYTSTNNSSMVIVLLNLQD